MFLFAQFHALLIIISDTDPGVLFLTAFSAYSNGKKIISTKVGPESIGVLGGLK
jgi:hypothetical protein